MRLFASFLLAGISVLAVTADGSAQTRHHAVRRAPAPRVATRRLSAPRVYDTSSRQSAPLTVNRRSWLDPGPVAPVGSGPSYVQASTILSRTQDRIFDPDKFGNSVIIGQPYVPGRTVPVVAFSSLPNGGAEIDNVLGPQNYYFYPAPSRPARAPSLYNNTDDAIGLP